MNARIRHTIISLFIVLANFTVCIAQQGFYVPNTAKVFFSGDSSTIFSNVINKGSLGVGKNATVNFVGKTWENDSKGMITDESQSGTGTSGDGGWIRFLSDSIRQQVIGGYNAATKKGASFNKFKVQNSLGIDLINSSAKVRKEISFNKGLMYLNQNVMVVGNNNPGTISGYDSTKYFVTGTNPNSGILVRENMKSSNRKVVFPVGTSSTSYTPAALQIRSISPDDYYVSVFDSVRVNATNGRTLLNETVNKTWQIGKVNPAGIHRVEVTLQHLVEDEGYIFVANRPRAYVSKYDGSHWDYGMPEGVPQAGNLTTGSLLYGSGINRRTFASAMETSSYYTVVTSLNVLAEKTKLWFNAYRLDTGNVKVYWNTNPEVNVKRFIIQRRLSTETNFSDVGSANSLAPNGYSVINLDYLSNDLNDYKGVSYYRLMMIPYTGANWYSDTVLVGPQIGLYNIMIWPNPAVDLFNVSWHKTLPVKAVIVWDVLGQKVREVSAVGVHQLQMRGLTPGTYFVSFVLTTNTIIETKKLLIRGGVE